MENNILVLIYDKSHSKLPSKEIMGKITNYYSSIGKKDYEERNLGEFEVITVSKGAKEENILFSLFYSHNIALMKKIEKIFDVQFFNVLGADFLEIPTEKFSVEEFMNKLKTEFELVLLIDEPPGVC